jgi:hypothetical protein
LSEPNRPTGLYCAYIEALARKAAKEGRIVPDTQAEALHRWREDHDLHDQGGLNVPEATRDERDKSNGKGQF